MIVRKYTRVNTTSDDTRQQINLLLARISQLENSTSWRITAPLRIIADRVKQLKANMRYTVLPIVGHLSFLGIKNARINTSANNPSKFSRKLIDGNLDKLEEIRTLFPSAYDKTVRENSVTLSQLGNYQPLVGVIVPSYNHAKYLERRIQSILNQSYTNIIVYVLDDASDDNSIEIIEKLSRENSRVNYILNSRRSGSVFKQWAKGLEILQSLPVDIWWICESDDSCDKDFLLHLVPYFKDQSVMLAFGLIDYIDESDDVLNGLEYYRKSTNELFWNEPTSRTAKSWLTQSFGAINIIPNSGGCLIRAQTLSKEELTTLAEYTIAGDWYFYVTCIRSGVGVYDNRSKAYFRQHSANTSVVRNNSVSYYEETLRVHDIISRRWGSASIRSLFIDHVARHQNAVHRGSIDDKFPFIERAQKLEVHKQVTHILIATLGFSLGGAEIFAIDMANALVEAGFTVSILITDVQSERTISHRLDTRIPVYNRYHVELWGITTFLNNLGIDIIHSHNIACETIFLDEPNVLNKTRYVVTLHGSYEVSTASKKRIEYWSKSVDAWVYLDRKNLTLVPRKHQRQVCIPAFSNPHKTYDLSRTLSFTRPVVFTLASRAIPEKGWEEAIRAFLIASERLKDKKSTDIKLILQLAGKGLEQTRLQNIYADLESVRFLGYVEDVYQLFAETDVVLLPTYFRGESMPAVLIQAMQLGRPIISTKLASIPSMCSDEGGSAALIIDDINDREALIEQLAHYMLQILDKKLYSTLQNNARRISEKFDRASVMRQYISLYEQILQT